MKLAVEKKSAGIRIDKFLKQEVFFNEKITRGQIIREIKNGHVLVNNNAIKPSYLLKKSDKIKMDVRERNSALKPNKNIKFNIIFQNEDFIIINKPAGVQVHPSNKEEQDTLVDGLIYSFPEIREVGDDPKIRPGIIHRLDRETSGLMVVARNQKTFLELKNKFKKREIEKIYAAVVFGRLEGKGGVIRKPIARSADYKKQVIAGRKTKTKIRSAVTHYKVLKVSDKYTLLEVMPKTGRMHQIRVHLSSIGHPVFGDAKYGKKDNDADLPDRHYLHAKKLNFELFGKAYEFESSVPEEFESKLDGKEI